MLSRLRSVIAAAAVLTAGCGGTATDPPDIAAPTSAAVTAAGLASTATTTAPVTTTTPTATTTPTPATTAGAAELPTTTTAVAASAPVGVGDSFYPGLGNPGYDVQHYEISLDVDPATNMIEASTAITALAAADPHARQDPGQARTGGLDFRSAGSPPTRPQPSVE